MVRFERNYWGTPKNLFCNSYISTMTKLTKEQKSKNMRAVKSSGSQIERKLGKALWNRGYKYRKNNKTVFGKPDFTFKQLKIAIFCDSEFWHGKDWDKKKNEFKSNIEFWHTKIESNIERDRRVNKELKSQGWKVLRFWGKEIKNDLDKCISTIENAINETKKND